ncbi:hypothetical protein ACFZAR_36440 [Streptomyces sp. NPDC008222]|uniref:hypothetical protein n=1 Tax=Streptomyces sp. NPDC008222 TaxID=3364820 RepID=UPI0036E21776
MRIYSRRARSERVVQGSAGSSGHPVLRDRLTKTAPELLELVTQSGGIPLRTPGHQPLCGRLALQATVAADVDNGVNDNRRGEHRGGTNRTRPHGALTSS